MSAVYYDAETELLLRADGSPYAVETKVFATTNQRQIALGVVRDITETVEVASFHNRITDTPADFPAAGSTQQKENA